MTTHKTFVSAAALVLGATLAAGGNAIADQVIPDDLIVQGSACIGLDCVNNESFGFSTIILKENNLRILFLDTSTLPGFPTNDWQLTANDSANGGASKFSIEDVTGAKVPFTVLAGAPTNSMFVASTGKVGLRTSTPVLDLHVTTSDTPAHRFEQTSAGGFTAQTWDVAGNEANFFVRDVTGGSRLPFRIRPGAPTSSIDIAANGNVGVNKVSAASKLMVSNGAYGGTPHPGSAATFEGAASTYVSVNTPDANERGLLFGSASDQIAGSVIYNNSNTPNGLQFRGNGNVTQMTIAANGNVGIGIGAAVGAAQLHTTGTVRFAGVAGCGAGIVSNASGDLACLSSSRQFKTVAGDLPANVALANIMALRPQTGSYKETPDVPEHWLIAEEVAAVDPALVGLHESKPYVVKTQNIVADLVAVVQQQQREIGELRRLLSAKP